MKQILDYQKIYEITRPIMVEGGKIANRYFHRLPKVEYKDVVVNNQPEKSIFTKADSEVEKFIRQRLKKAFPEFGFVGEESSQSDIREYNWILDPIDGTQNFIRGIPIFCQALALWHKNAPAYGIVYLPFLKQVIYAYASGGLRVNNMQVKRTYPAPGGPYLQFALGGSPREMKLVAAAATETITRFSSYYSAVYHGILCALGKVDVAIYYKLGLWDVATGILFAQEAGLMCEYLSPKPDLNSKNRKSYQHSLVIGNKKWVPQIAAAIKKLNIT